MKKNPLMPLLLVVMVVACTTKIDPNESGLDSKSSLRVGKAEIDKLYNTDYEGLNNLIRSIRRVSFGVPNFENPRWRAFAISV
ncbi:MAG: hypothetical protein EAZ32_06645 [Cytophagia bacterium]|nr:MAG: hypothetical protein EAZ38_08920 [Cytophagales bacterium]TAG40409.1 MAG: hypothetical protein EAZ32_06645 [Cytophagia bacterium]TAG81990.1 MAG: hypothetical protein EAZ22_06175 [Cytophagales bacterium]